MKLADIKNSPAGKIALAALLAFGAGGLGGTAYLRLGGEYLINIPPWASIVFYPGFFAGFWAFDHWHVGVGFAQAIGVLAVGLAYALIAALARWIWITVKRWRNNQVHNDNPNPSQL
jgi:hypothetical protein